MLQKEHSTRVQASSLAWDLHDVLPMSADPTGRVFKCQSPMGPAVLKLGLNDRDLDFMVRAQNLFGEQLCPRVFAHSAENCAVLMEFVENFGDLSKLFPDEAQEIRIWLKFYDAIRAKEPVRDQFPPLAEFAEVFTRVHSEGDGQKIMQIAWERREVLIDDPKLLHGDLHHFNILHSRTGGWLMIDPHGVIGNPLYEVGAFLRNPWPSIGEATSMHALLERRVDALAEVLCEAKERIALFGFYGAAFSIAWDIEDGIQVPFQMLEIANILLSLSERSV